MSHAAAIVAKTNDTPATPNPTMYQIPVKRGSLRAAAGRPDLVRSRRWSGSLEVAHGVHWGRHAASHSSRGGVRDGCRATSGRAQMPTGMTIWKGQQA